MEQYKCWLSFSSFIPPLTRANDFFSSYVAVREWRTVRTLGYGQHRCSSGLTPPSTSLTSAGDALFLLQQRGCSLHLHPYLFLLQAFLGSDSLANLPPMTWTHHFVAWIVSPKKIHSSLTLVPVKVALWGMRVFAVVIKLRWGPAGYGWAVNPMGSVLTRRGRLETCRDAGGRRRQSSEWCSHKPRVPGASRCWTRQGGVSLGSSGGVWPYQQPDQASDLQDSEKTHLAVISLPGWSFVTIAMGP